MNTIIKSILPPTWLIILIVGLPMLCETIYTPSLPAIAMSLNTSETLVEYTLTAYLCSFAFGILFWGIISDKFGRKPSVIAGMIVFVLGSVLCYFSKSIEILLIARFIQGFGGSIGSVMGQAICRDAFTGSALNKIYSSVMVGLAFFPAIGPTIGAIIAQTFGWINIFLFLIIVTIILQICVFLYLPETHSKNKRLPFIITDVFFKFIVDKKVLGFGLIVGGCHGISFSYYAEGSFYLQKILHLSPTEYGFSFVFIALSTIFSSIVARKLYHIGGEKVMQYGLIIILIAGFIFSFLAFCYTYYDFLSLTNMIIIVIVFQTIMHFGICLTNIYGLSLALINYKSSIGTASSIFGFIYYSIVSICTFGMGYIHDGTALTMPLYFLAIAVFMLILYKFTIKEKQILNTQS